MYVCVCVLDIAARRLYASKSIELGINCRDSGIGELNAKSHRHYRSKNDKLHSPTDEKQIFSILNYEGNLNIKFITVSQV